MDPPRVVENGCPFGVRHPTTLAGVLSSTPFLASGLFSSLAKHSREGPVVGRGLALPAVRCRVYIYRTQGPPMNAPA